MQTNSKTLKKRAATCVVTLTAAGLSFGVIGCGGSDGEAVANTAASSGSQAATSGPGAPPAGAPSGGPFAELTEAQIRCLKQEDVSIPDSPASGEAPSSAGSSGAPPQGGEMPDSEELQAAAEACDIDLPEPPAEGDSPADGEMPQGTPPPAAAS